ncbi:uncharacterized protein LOC110875407 [Helianthus annuus]|uniref:uncharacterized protein LOC110875407 n=1 Tax=Helianthus annuus TaxID=4232 RepID=UPI000B8F73FF|nr:uncharacterized protein LOC110875407 [Helianthus annuus]
MIRIRIIVEYYPALVLETSSLGKMDNLKYLWLKDVKFTGPYNVFPELRLLSWLGCPLKTIPPGLLMSSLVALDMSNGHLEKFDSPMVLDSLKILNLESCCKLVGVYNLYKLPKLACLYLHNCSSLTHLCKSIGDLESLGILDLTGCTKLWKASSNFCIGFVNQLQRLKSLQIGRFQAQPLFSLPWSLQYLHLDFCDLGYNNDLNVLFHPESLFCLTLRCNPFERLPSNFNLNMLRVLSLSLCQNLKSLPCIPKTLEELNIDWCISLDRVTFQSGLFSLQRFSYEGCFQLSEVEGLFKLVPIEKIDEADLGHMRWIKAYQDYKVDLVGDEITKRRDWRMQWRTQEFFHGVRNILKDFSPVGSKDNDELALLAKISNRSKGLTWVYNPVVYCAPRSDEDVVWLSYWPIGNMLGVGDEVNVDIHVQIGTMIVSGCGASLVYADSEVDQEDNCENNLMKEKEVIGGDLSEFEVTTGGYYLCRRDLFGSETSSWLERLFGDNVYYTDSHGWRKTRQTMSLYQPHNSNEVEVVLGVSFNSESEIGKIEKAVSSVMGVESISTRKEVGRITVAGRFDREEMATRVREFGKRVNILYLDNVN